MTYQVHLGLFMVLSPVWAAILAIPSGRDSTDPNREGTATNPVFLAGIATEEWQDFLVYIYRK
jgi:hypothetical protein